MQGVLCMRHTPVPNTVETNSLLIMKYTTTWPQNFWSTPVIFDKHIWPIFLKYWYWDIFIIYVTVETVVLAFAPWSNFLSTYNIWNSLSVL